MFFISQIALAAPCIPGASGLPCPEQAVLDTVDEAFQYRLLHDLTVSNTGSFISLGGVPWSVDNTAAAASQTWSRIAVLMELDNDYVWVSMDDYTGDDATLAGIANSHLQFVFQQQVTNMNVRSNVVTNRDGVPGNIEIWPYNYGREAALPGIGGDPDHYDFNDTHTNSSSYGSYQFHDFNAGETLLAFNRFNDTHSCDIGIGNSPGQHSDWTFADTCPGFASKRIRIFLKVDGGNALVENVVGGTPGFGTVLGSGPTKFDLGFIESRLVGLEDAWAGAGCTTERWAGTQSRGRAPVLLGETDGGRTITGPSLANGDVNGTAFTASLAGGGRLTGTTTDGTELEGYFARVGSRKSIWYGVEATCNVLN